ncbi:MAG TPA: beta-ketoacyl-ACP reductase [Tissierellia bacterium]|nr:beta-ketoacyl-ACP reductase [Tissierellia bacterium]
MRLQDKIAIVTGASQGIGQAIAETFVREGAIVLNLSITQPVYDNDRVTFYPVDVTDRTELEKLIPELHRAYGRFDILVNNAGITRDALMTRMSEDMWDAVIDINLKGVFNVTQLVAPYMIEQQTGSIINISSVVGEYGNIGQTNYAATKAGVVAMAKTWAKEFTRKGGAVRVNAIAPGFINTDMMKTVPDKVLDPIRQKTPLKRLGEPQEIANAALFLASEEASFITGHLLSVNGGIVL